MYYILYISPFDPLHLLWYILHIQSINKKQIICTSGVMPCSTVRPLPECGLHGTCAVVVDPSNETSTYCSCDDGWGQSLEWNYFTNNQDSLSSSICMYNRRVIDGLWVAALVGFLIVFVLFFGLVRSRRDLFQYRHILVICTLASATTIYRVLNPTTAQIGVEFTFSFLMSLCFVFYAFVVDQIFGESLKYLSDKASMMNVQGFFLGHLHQLRVLGLSAMVLVCICAQFFWITTFVSDQARQSTAKTLMRCLWISIIIHYSFLTIAYTKLFSELLTDMEQIVSGTKFIPNSNTSADVIRWAELYIPKIKMMKFVCQNIFSTWVINAVGCIVSDFW
mmetsp:Transcript_32383/g.39858  ORF Transcript_32383/g.39858 Transcript_32383/m.39858 type:complete len:335 (-) Transcript_32383:963-1967(-)